MATKKITIEIEIPTISSNSDAYNEILENKKAKDYVDKLTNQKIFELRNYMITWLVEFGKEWFSKFPKEELRVCLNHIELESIKFCTNKDIAFFFRLQETTLSYVNYDIIYNYAANTWINLPHIKDIQTLVENWDLIKQACKKSMDSKLQQLYDKSTNDLRKAQERLSVIHNFYKNIMKGDEN